MLTAFTGKSHTFMKGHIENKIVCFAMRGKWAILISIPQNKLRKYLSAVLRGCAGLNSVNSIKLSSDIGFMLLGFRVLYPNFMLKLNIYRKG